MEGREGSCGARVNPEREARECESLRCLLIEIKLSLLPNERRYFYNLWPRYAKYLLLTFLSKLFH